MYEAILKCRVQLSGYIFGTPTWVWFKLFKINVIHPKIYILSDESIINTNQSYPLAKHIFSMKNF